jgi:uncharacterized protein involved in exopolysaccharide biosynthesis
MEARSEAKEMNHNPPQENLLHLGERYEPSAISLRDVVAPIFRHRRLVLYSFLAILLGAILASIFLPKQYQAEMKILVKRERIDETVTSNKATVLEAHPEVTEEQVQSEVELIRSRDLLENVARESGIVSAGGETSSVTLAKAVRDLQNHLQIEPLKKTNLISISYRTGDPVLAARVLNVLANLYLQKHLDVHRLPGTFDFFQKQTERYRNELATSEEQLVGFDRTAGVVSPELEKEMSLRKQSEYESSLRQARADIAETTERIRSLEAQISKTSPRTTTQERVSDNPILLQQMKSTLLTLELKRTELLTKFSPEYLPVREVDKQIEQTRLAIETAEKAPLHEETTDNDPTYAWMRAEQAKDRTQLIALQARVQALAPIVESYRVETRSLDEKGATKQDLVRAAKTAEENYLLYSQKEEEARIADALDRNRIVNVAVAEVATVPALPVHSSRYIFLLGVMLAACFSLALGFIADFVDPSFQTPQDLRNALDIPVLAAVPREAA